MIVAGEVNLCIGQVAPTAPARGQSGRRMATDAAEGLSVLTGHANTESSMQRGRNAKID